MSQLASLQLDDLQKNASLAKYTAARLGGRADWLYLAKKSVFELADVVKTAWADNLPVRVLGGGANVLVSDKGVRGLVVINRVSQIDFGNWHNGRNVSATSGTGLLRLARECANHGIAGMEWAVGVPGTVGGAVVNNAGAHNSDMAFCVADVVVLEANNFPKIYTNAEMQYNYRHSMLKSRVDRQFVILQTNFILPYDSPDAIQQRMEEFNAYRKRTQPPGASLGSIFKNPEGDYAGRLIEASDLKGCHIGGVEVSRKHANFFVVQADDKATASDYYRLIRHVQETVMAKQGVTLELEIELVGEWT
jgi:UDP-N-acetylmuramate dehydrogenase